MPDEIECTTFEESVGELVLDLLEPAGRTALLHHAAGCSRCQAELHSLSAIADQLATVAPECEPPVGFEARVLAMFTPPVIAPADAVSRRVRRHPVAGALLAAAAAALLGVWVGHSFTGAGHETAATSTPALAGTLLAEDGAEHGWVLVTTAADGAGATLTMHLSDLRPGTYRCLFVAADGATTEVAAWPIDDSGAGQWTIAVAAPTAGERVVVVADSGATVATADLSEA